MEVHRTYIATKAKLAPSCIFSGGFSPSLQEDLSWNDVDADVKSSKPTKKGRVHSLFQV